uniref:Uncharacterized protein n=1 Tax=Polytomella parva TaxID=51329 RepID=A0A7S0V546_9CHLO|mmetsp:Transcript_30062/g.54956  ORF Transcript_30062/g.54956 Transcript_30062/m.54956 type:complete len:149 (+) Transcript_30062:167-613(+)|eukprot:CAMPEP_0175057058 /NCGR_PEP_ID=MMETSP0052_2-20121109/11039_1 /TAXON_ID=51329 ORGANISM="Polytomella parva, Strain SAG 63-3" /NCGR_SAMPLE_ID=MMETSP0052_2 /ASSEMBLY_ACC=CAM_ASM_000194 /LENGTH=148 /DNA_ID=CAMNT_0016322201 /DNA_START=96 /DNA_END=542 /DNA_ORIENTATION=-
MVKKSKKKGPTLITTPEDISSFGFQLNDIVRTPVGLTATVIGVKYDSPEAKETGRVWVKYENGHEAPLEPRLGSGFMNQLGYRRCGEADHIRRDVTQHALEMKKLDDERKVVEEILRCKEQGLPIPENLLPKEKPKKKKKEDKDKKKK